MASGYPPPLGSDGDQSLFIFRGRKYCRSRARKNQRQLVEIEEFGPHFGLPRRSYVLERRLIRTGLFDTVWYKSQYPEEAESGLSAARH